MMKRFAMVLIVVLVLVHVTLIIPQAKAGEFRYSVAPLNIPLPAAAPSTMWMDSQMNLMDINDNRQIVGSARYYDPSWDDHNAAVFWEPGMTEATVMIWLGDREGHRRQQRISACPVFGES